MVNKNDFVAFLIETFNKELVFIEKFKPDLWFIEVDCFPEKLYKMAIELSSLDIKISTVNKQPSIDFSLYEYFFKSNEEAENFIKENVEW